MARLAERNQMALLANRAFQAAPSSLMFIFFVASLLSPVYASASLDLDRCCMLSAREQLVALQVVPWEACGINTTSSTNPPVKTTLGWCEENCPGFQLSSFGQWSDLLTTFVVPAFALLILCPVGSGKHEADEQEEEEREEEELEQEKPGTAEKTPDPKSTASAQSQLDDHNPKKKRKHGLQGMLYLAQEYTILLGDPASAIAGSFYQLWSDFWLVKELSTKEKVHELDEDARGFAILSSQTHIQHIERLNAGVTEMREEDIHELVNIVKKAIKADPTSKSTAPPAKQSSSESGHNTIEQPTPATNPTSTSPPPSSLLSRPHLDHLDSYHSSAFRPLLRQTIRTLLLAKIDFVNGVVVPVVLTFAGTAAGFYGAYTVLGDRDKAYSLAYGVFYAWLLVLAVGGNCYATTVNEGLLGTELVRLVRVCEGIDEQPEEESHYRIRVVPFRRRFPTCTIWMRWVQMVMAREHSPKLPPLRNAWFFVKFFVLQTLGWAVICFFVVCATLIAWNTPTTGLGCRSFNFILYAVLALILAWLIVLREAVSDKWKRLGRLLQYLYGFLALLNAFVLAGGTTFHLIGLYRSCRCQLFFGRSHDIVLLSKNTQLDIDNASKWWISVGYVAFTIAWMVSAVMIGFREYIYIHLADRKFVSED